MFEYVLVDGVNEGVVCFWNCGWIKLVGEVCLEVLVVVWGINVIGVI